MPRYFFHTTNGSPHTDREGVDLPGVDAAREEAARMVAELMKVHAREFWQSESLSVIVSDGTGLILSTIVVAGVTAPAVTRHKVAQA